jgi:hypothetical protein
MCDERKTVTVLAGRLCATARTEIRVGWVDAQVPDTFSVESCIVLVLHIFLSKSESVRTYIQHSPASLSVPALLLPVIVVYLSPLRQLLSQQLQPPCSPFHCRSSLLVARSALPGRCCYLSVSCKPIPALPALSTTVSPWFIVSPPRFHFVRPSPRPAALHS